MILFSALGPVRFWVCHAFLAFFLSNLLSVSLGVSFATLSVASLGLFVIKLLASPVFIYAKIF